MEALIEQGGRTFVEVTEYWVPEDGVLKLAGGDHGDLTDFADASGQTGFAKGEGLPGKAWAEGRPIILKGFDPATLKRADAARAAGLCAVDGPLWDEDKPRRAAAWQGPIGSALGTGLPVVGQNVGGLPAGYDRMVAIPPHSRGELTHVVAWYS